MSGKQFSKGGQTSTASSLQVSPAGEKGAGLFAQRAFMPDEAISVFVSLETNAAGYDPEAFLIIPWSANEWLVMPKMVTSPLYFLNHSCDANAWLGEDGYTLVARRTIADGEEITVDYAAFEHDVNAVCEWSCLCGSAGCRIRVTGKDLPRLDKSFAKHITPYLRQRQQHE